jgi:hypothetical protein
MPVCNRSLQRDEQPSGHQHEHRYTFADTLHGNHWSATPRNQAPDALIDFLKTL